MNAEWEAWREAWRAEEAPASPPAIVVLERALARHRRLARTHTALDVTTSLAMCGAAGCMAYLDPSLPMIVWAASVVVFSFAIVGVAAWNRRDALFASEQAATTFLEQSLLRLRRRERLPRMLIGFAVTESIFSLGFCEIWFPARLAPVAGYLLAVVLAVGAWSRWQSRRLRAERAGLEKLRGEISE